MLLIPILAFGFATVNISQYFSFIVPYQQENLYLMVIIGGIYGVNRPTGEVGI